jgi:hypothetical protein
MQPVIDDIHAPLQAAIAATILICLTSSIADFICAKTLVCSLYQYQHDMDAVNPIANDVLA